MANLLSFPFRVSGFGAAVSVDQGGDTYYREQIAVIMLTVRGERPTREDFGMPDIAYKGFQYSAFYSQVMAEMPEISNLKTRIEVIDDRTENVVVEFDLSRESR